MKSSTIARLLITCPDQPGIVAAVTTFFYNHGANITMLDQHSTDPEGGTFFMRLEFQTPRLDVERKVLEETFARAVATRFQMDWKISYASDTKNMVIMVSRYDHALLELLWRNRRKELPANITMVISNHPDLEKAVANFNIPYHHIPVNKDNKAEAEAEILSRIDGHADLIVLARYMQILSKEFVSHFPNRIINIHHSFLPAFVGANPYRQACERGVKLIGATAHYVTVNLDEGPIIEQEVTRVSHRYDADEMKEAGMSVERTAIARAVKWHLEDRIIVQSNRTIVFN
jgi:formyltetrahydrofolate deformylase